MLKILSGGQTGVDRAVLDATIAKNLAYGGWCPKGGWAEDMPRAPGLLAFYPELQETPCADPAQRTEWNVRDADRLMILVDAHGLNSRGIQHAIRYAEALRRPVLVLNLDASGDLDRAAQWLGEVLEKPLVVCNAGPRESEAPGIYQDALSFLMAAFDRL
jgi:hypothetical protein